MSVCGTGDACLHSGFSRQWSVSGFAFITKAPRRASASPRGFACAVRLLPLVRDVHRPDPPSLLRHHFCQTECIGAGISTCCPSATPFGLALGPALPWADEPSPGILGLTVSVFLTHFALLMPAFSLPQGPRRLAAVASPPEERSPTNHTHKHARFRGFGDMLSPLYFRRGNPRPVSCYALFKGWLLLSQPPGCLGISTSLPH